MAKLLLAEDNELSRHTLVRRLERSGHHVQAAADGLEAVRMACKLPPDLILMDLDMPVMDGRAAIEALKSDPRTSRIPIMVLTAHTSAQDVADAVKARCQAYETKPVVLRRLLERIDSLLGG